MPSSLATRLTLGLCIFAVGVGMFTAPAAAQRGGDVIDGIIAVVGNQPILRSDVEAMATQLARGARPNAEQRRIALDDLITQHVVAVHAERDTTVVISEDEVSQALRERTQQLVRQLGSEEAVEQLYNKSIAQLQEDYRTDVRRQLRAQALQRKVFFNVRITPQEVRQWFHAIPADSLPMIPELVRVAHIVRFPEIVPAARVAARGSIEAIRDSIVAGTPLEDLARRHSDDPGSRQQGGRYAGINLRDLVPEFGMVASTLEPGELSQVFETQFGYHVLRLNARRGDVIDFNHILIQIDQSQTDSSAALRTLQMVRDSVVVRGASFARLAREFSEDPSSAARGGNIVVPQTGDRDLRFEALGPLWQNTIAGLEVGDISPPTEAQLLDGRQAYHVVLLQRRVPEHRMSLDMDYPLIEELALQDKRQRMLEDWIAGLRGSTYISCKDDRLCAGLVPAPTARR
jgi:peptidyl-prolyl cis-trans isomerase SurA